MRRARRGEEAMHRRTGNTARRLPTYATPDASLKFRTLERRRPANSLHGLDSAWVGSAQLPHYRSSAIELLQDENRTLQVRQGLESLAKLEHLQ